MSTENTTAATDSGEAIVVEKLSTLDRFLAVWILPPWPSACCSET